jgi:uncharacterized protein (TIGR03086 family)
MERRTQPDETSRLVALGRDREAAGRHAIRGGTVNTTEQLDAILPDLVAIAGNITPDQLGNPTPCADFDVRAVLNHMIGGARFFAVQLRGDAMTAPPEPGVDLTGEDPIATFMAAMDELAEALRTPGALERTVVAPFGEVPGEVVARFLTLDGMVHAYDLAVGTGQVYSPPDDLAGQVLATAQQAIAPEMRDGDTFADAVTEPTDASNLVRLVAFTGRAV